MKSISEAQMRRYFSETSVFVRAIIAIVIGSIWTAVFTVFGSQYQVFALVGLLPLIGGTIFLFWLAAKPGDREYEQWLEDQRGALTSTVLQKLNIDRSQVAGMQKLYLHSFVLPGSADAQKYTDARAKKGKDGYWRFSINVYTYFIPADDHFAIFSSDINALHQSSHVEEAHHYYYPDIVGMVIQDIQDTIKFKGKEYRVVLQRFTLKISSGDSISIGGAFSAKAVDKQKSNIPFTATNTELQQTVAALLLMLRSKRQSNP